jgi:murein DD-endopeptidase MepM/ murein hydrolase activator NlpD
LLKILTDLGSSKENSLTIIDAVKKAKPSYTLNSGNIIKITYSVQIDYHKETTSSTLQTSAITNELDHQKILKDQKKAKINTKTKNNKEKNKIIKNIKKPNSEIVNQQLQNQDYLNYQNIKRNIKIEKIIINLNNQQQIIVQKKQENPVLYNADLKEIKLNLYKMRYFGVIKNGLFIDGVDSGISAATMMKMINLYSYDIDFQRDIHDGDKFEVLIESFFDENGRKIKDGNLLYSAISLNNQKVETYAHEINNIIEYFDAKGNSVRKSLLKTPINGARISSGFGMRRHPILGYSKMHKGVDFAAPTGTPILAAGSGIITYMGVKGGYGNYVQIKHNADYSTAYGHASKFNKKFKHGNKVKQGDVVAYVGSTGRSTGPHLHFELIYKGNQVNPSKVKATSGLKLTGKDLVKFELTKTAIDKYRKNTPNQYKI